MFKKVLIFTFIGAANAVPSSTLAAVDACGPVVLKSCSHSQETVRLEELTFNRLERDVTTFRKVRTQYFKKYFKTHKKPKTLSRCFDVNHANFYMISIRKMAKKNKGKVCDNQLQHLYMSINPLTNLKSEELSAVKDENTKMTLMKQAMEVSEALLYFKNKHTK